MFWVVDRFDQLVHGIHFDVENVHRALVTVLGWAELNMILPRIQGIRTRHIKYKSYLHVSGKVILTVDSLSTVPFDNLDNKTVDAVYLLLEELFL